MLIADTAVAEPWRDPLLDHDSRAAALIAQMTVPEKVSQLVGLWVGADGGGGDVAPRQGEMIGDVSFADVIVDGLGQLTRPFGTAPVDPVTGAASLARSQHTIMAANRFGIPAQVHEECLAGLVAWGATAYPVPLTWGATFNPALVGTMADQIGRSMRSVGVHQGLAPVLDVVQDYRWGRVEETVGEDPRLVGAICAAYVKGLEDAGVVATLKHFVGYSGSRTARNHAPVSAGPRELADIFLPPFEMALRLGGARSVMNSYAAVDGVPAAADQGRLTGLLREEWGFDGVVVADYFAIAFLRTMQRIAGSDAEAARLALTAGIDVELPSVATFGEPLLAALEAGEVNEDLIDRALHRVLVQKIQLGLLEPDYRPEVEGAITFDTAEAQDTALQLAREGVVLVANDGTLPLGPGQSIAVIGPLADDPYGMLGCYSFPAHVGVHHPQFGMGVEIPTLLEAMREQFTVAHAEGCDVMAPGRDGFGAAIEAARSAEVAVVVLGDRAGLFGRGTSGEGCDASDLTLPGEQQALLEAVLDTGTPVVLVLLAGRPYALGGVAERSAAIVQTFFPGQRGAQAITEIVTGAINPSGHLPLAIPREPAEHVSSHLAPLLGLANGITNLDSTPLYPFGHGLSYAELQWGDVTADASTWATDGEITLTVAVRNESGRAVADVVQVYVHDPVAQVVRPEQRLVAFQRVEVPAGGSADVRFHVHADLTAFAGLMGTLVVEPGSVELRVARSAADVHHRLPLEMVGPERVVGADRVLVARSSVESAAAIH